VAESLFGYRQGQSEGNSVVLELFEPRKSNGTGSPSVTNLAREALRLAVGNTNAPVARALAAVVHLTRRACRLLGRQMGRQIAFAGTCW